MYPELKKIVIFDPYPLYGLGIKLILEKEKDLYITSLSNTYQELIRHFKSEISDLLIISSIHFTDDIFSLLRRMDDQFPQLPVLLITDHEMVFNEKRMMDSNIKGLVYCNSLPEKLISAIRVLLAGNIFFPDDILDSERKKRKYTSKDCNNKENIDFPKLTERESEILRHFAKGLTYKEIANQLFISSRTVETHKKNIITKLGLHSKTDIIKYAMIHNLI